MIIVLKPKSTKQDADEILQSISELGCKPLYMPGTERVVLGAIGDERVLGSLNLEGHPKVESVTPVLSPYKLVSREMHPHDTLVPIGPTVLVGGEKFTVIAGPCAVENEAQMLASGQAAKDAGATCLRGGAFKPRTSPHSFQGLGVQGLEILADVGRKLNMPTVTEVVDAADVETVASYADVLQVGARNMQNFRMLQELGRCSKPVILKRGMAASIQDFLLAAEYIVNEGNPNVILCERGIRTFETTMRNTLDLAAVPYIKLKTHLPVMVEPSHGTGIRDLVSPMSRAAAACGADGIMVEVHCNPAKAVSDGAQSLYPQQFSTLMKDLRIIVEAMGKSL